MITNVEIILTNVIHLIDDRERAIIVNAHSTVEELNSCIIRPRMQATTFKLKLVMFQMLQTIGKFHELPSKDSHLHLKSIYGVSDPFKFQGMDKDMIRPSLFPYSFRNDAKSWLNTLTPRAIDSWNFLGEKFLSSIFHPQEIHGW